LSWLPAIYRDRGTDAATAGALLGILTAFGIVGNIAAPLAASRLPDQRLVVLIASLLTMAAIIGIMAAPPQTTVIWVLLLAVGASGSFSLSLFLMASRHRDAARLSSMAQGLGYLIAAGGPPLAGFLHATSGGWTVPLVATLGISVFQLTAGLLAARSPVDA
jgi:CP family cyanate transporter-like MFS transporter